MYFFNNLLATYNYNELLTPFKEQIGKLFQIFGVSYPLQETFNKNFDTRYYYNFIAADNSLGAIKIDIGQKLKQEIFEDLNAGFHV